MSKTHGFHQGILGTLTKYISKDNFRPPHEGDFGFTELLDALAGGRTIDNCFPQQPCSLSTLGDEWSVEYTGPLILQEIFTSLRGG